MRKKLKNKVHNSNSNKSYDYIVYLCCIPFIVPLLYTLSTKNMTYIGGWYVAWSFTFILLLGINYKKLLTEIDQITFSQKSLFILFILVFCSFSYTSVAKFQAFYTPARDPGIFFTMVQAIIGGNFGFSSVAGIYHFGTHQNYILILFTPLYLMAKSPLILQVIGAASIWAAGIVLWKIARIYFNQLIALAVVITYYASPSNHFYGFRPELFYPLALFTLFYVCQIRAKLWLIILATLFLLSIKEDAPLYMGGFIFILLFNKNYKAGVTVIGLTIAVMMINIGLVQPYFVAKDGKQVADTLSFFSGWGSSNREIIINILSNPLKVLTLLFDSHSGFWYSYGYWLFLPLAYPFVIFSSILPLILFTISNNPTHHALAEYYPIGISALAYLGFIYVGYYIIKRLSSSRFSNLLKVTVLFLVLIHNLLFVRFYDLIQHVDYSAMTNTQIFELLQSAPMYRGRWQEFFPIDHENLSEFAKLKEDLLFKYKNAPICPTNQIYPHLDYLDFPNLQKFGFEQVNQPNCINVFAIIGDIWPVRPASLQEQINTMLQTQKCNQYGNFFFCDNLNHGAAQPKRVPHK